MDYGAFRNYIDNEPDLAGNHPWTPRGNLDATGQYRPEDISDIKERNESAYLRLDFGSDIGSDGMSIDGNIGVRFVKTTLESAGAFSYLPFNADPQTDSTPEAPRTPDAESHDDPRDFLPETTAFLEQAATPILVDQDDTDWLPSLNVKWNFNDNMLMRFGASKAVTRPNVQDLRASQRVEANTTRVNFPPITDPNDPLFGVDRGAQDINLNRLVITRGNPVLLPTEAVNLDLSFEWYFQGGYFSAAVFNKDLEEHHLHGRPAGRHREPGRANGRRRIQRPDQPGVGRSLRLRGGVPEVLRRAARLDVAPGCPDQLHQHPGLGRTAGQRVLMRMAMASRTT